MGICFVLKPSAALMVSYLVLHLVAATSLLFAGLAFITTSLLLICLLGSAICCSKVASLRSDNSIIKVLPDGEGCVLELSSGRRVPVRLRQGYCLSWLQLASFSRTGAPTADCAQRRFTLLVLPDSADAADRRRLRSWLRMAFLAPVSEDA